MTSSIAIEKFCILLINNAVMGLSDRICLTSSHCDVILRLNYTYLCHRWLSQASCQQTNVSFNFSNKCLPVIVPCKLYELSDYS